MIKALSNYRPAGLSTGLFLFIFISFLFSSCEQQEKESELRPDTNMGGSVVQQQAVQPEQILPQLLEIQEQIVLQPDNAELHQKFTELALDKNRQVIYTAGTGKFPPDAVNTAMARQSAERAAFIDACRWGAYALKWKDNPASVAFGEIKGDLPNARILHKSATDTGALALVEIQLVY